MNRLTFLKSLFLAPFAAKAAQVCLKPAKAPEVALDLAKGPDVSVSYWCKRIEPNILEIDSYVFEPQFEGCFWDDLDEGISKQMGFPSHALRNYRNAIVLNRDAFAVQAGEYLPANCAVTIRDGKAYRA